MFIFRQRKLFKLKAWQKSLQSLKEEVHGKHWFHHHLLRQHGISPCHLQRNQDKLQQNPYQSTFIGKKLTKLKIIKVHIFWEGHKILRNLHLTFVLCSASRNKVKIPQNFVVFSEYVNF